ELLEERLLLRREELQRRRNRVVEARAKRVVERALTRDRRRHPLDGLVRPRDVLERFVVFVRVLGVDLELALLDVPVRLRIVLAEDLRNGARVPVVAGLVVVLRVDLLIELRELGLGGVVRVRRELRLLLPVLVRRLVIEVLPRLDGRREPVAIARIARRLLQLRDRPTRFERV